MITDTDMSLMVEKDIKRYYIQYLDITKQHIYQGKYPSFQPWPSG